MYVYKQQRGLRQMTDEQNTILRDKLMERQISMYSTYVDESGIVEVCYNNTEFKVRFDENNRLVQVK